MYLIFPESMIIPEVADRREDDDFEDWLTAAPQGLSRCAQSSASSIRADSAKREEIRIPLAGGAGGRVLLLLFLQSVVVDISRKRRS
jgi:hypothetical protein